MAESKKVVPYDHWWCETCKDGKQMERHEMFDHLQTAHGINPDQMKGEKQMRMHADGADFFTYSWNISIVDPKGGEISLTNNTLDERDEESKRWWT